MSIKENKSDLFQQVFLKNKCKNDYKALSIEAGPQWCSVYDSGYTIAALIISLKRCP